MMAGSATARFGPTGHWDRSRDKGSDPLTGGGYAFKSSVSLALRFEVRDVCSPDLRKIVLDLCALHAAFGDFSTVTQTDREDRSAWLDGILYRGEEREIAFPCLKEPTVCFVLRMQPSPSHKAFFSALSFSAGSRDGTLSALWKREGRGPLALEVSAVSQKEGAQRQSARARIGFKNARE
jgi:hypothetical protein